MKYLSITDLRKKSSILKDASKKGETIYIVHRSKIIGIFEPYVDQPKVATRENLDAFFDAFPIEKHISYEKRRSIYRKHLLKKYGKDLS